MAAGVGKRRIAVTIGLSESALCALLYGRPGRPPSRRIRATTARKLLALNPNSMAPGRVSAEGTRRRIEKLMSRGWSRSQLAAELGMSRSSIAQLPKQRQVYASTAAKVLALYARLPDAERAA